MGDLLERLAQQLIARVTDDLADAVVHSEPAPVEPDQRQPDRRLRKDRLELRVQLLGRPIGLDARGHVGGDGDGPDDLAVAANRADLHPVDGSVQRGVEAGPRAGEREPVVRLDECERLRRKDLRKGPAFGLRPPA